MGAGIDKANVTLDDLNAWRVLPPAGRPGSGQKRAVRASRCIYGDNPQKHLACVLELPEAVYGHLAFFIGAFSRLERMIFACGPA